ncbi:MAG: GHMP kinase, partial [Clostridiales bacterium]|nr:GHMP kinase [Clostridiales bacterium]
MIITRSPFRITFGGGGTDLPSYYRKYGGFLISAAIDKYVYLTIHKTFVEELLIKYSRLEKVGSVDEVTHPIIRECLKELNVSGRYLEITSLADIPSGTGLGSSGSFTTALLKALYTYNNQIISTRFLAEQACKIELDRLGEPIGKQDQYIAAFGGITVFEFLQNEKIEISPLNLQKEILYNLEDNLVLFFTGYSRSASSILKEQDDKSKVNDDEITKNLHFVKDLGRQSKLALESGNLIEFGQLMNVHWEHKKKRSGNMSNNKIDEWYALALKNGAIGGKLIGAGGGGFLMFYTENKMKLRHALMKKGLEEVRFKFDFEG